MLCNLIASQHIQLELPNRLNLGEGGNSHIIKTRWSSYLLRVKRAVLVPISEFSLKRSTVGAFTVPVRVLS